LRFKACGSADIHDSLIVLVLVRMLPSLSCHYGIM